ncbi:ATP-grasp domain-containing protein [Adlercreutzia sp. ZJ242]|uniref:carboxylate--amine ligase n=1 Tax=Adlercreutzia sp. ZJ242 TaxID=2709409 RepID=UPI0013EBABE8|nr:ATP-grasp domain-containing protein [Adlercreutzia sp. ZJ242]
MTTTADFVPVLLGGDANAYGMARSFYEEYGTKSHVVCKGAFHICQNSKLLSIDVVEPNLEDDEVFTRTLLDFALRFEGRTLVLAPCGDNYTKMLVRNQDALRDAYRFSIMTPDQFDLLSTKERFYGTCERYGLEFPKTCEVTKDAAKGFKPPFDYPVVVKPSNSVMYWNCSYPGKKKVFVVRDQAEMDAILAGVYSSSYDDAMIVQDFVPGDDSRMRVMNCYSDRNGRVTMMALGDVLLEEHTPEGIGSYGAIMTGYDPAVNERIKGFLEEIGYIGFSNFDLKLDERDGSYKLFEINPRQGRSSYFTTASGKNLARYLVRDVVEGRDDACEVATLDDEVLWTMIPLEVIRTYVSEPDVLARAERLMREGRVRWSYWSEDDRSLMRWVSFKVNQRNYKKQYAACFNRRHVND